LIHAGDTGPTPPDLARLREAVRRRDQTVDEIVARAADAGIPMTIPQARLAYDITQEVTAR
jgi:hypothetical protein